MTTTNRTPITPHQQKPVTLTWRSITAGTAVGLLLSYSPVTAGNIENPGTLPVAPPPSTPVGCGDRDTGFWYLLQRIPDQTELAIAEKPSQETGYLGKYDHDNNRITIAADIWDNNAPTWYGFVTLAHEIGHALHYTHHLPTELGAGEQSFDYWLHHDELVAATVGRALLEQAGLTECNLVEWRLNVGDLIVHHLHTPAPHAMTRSEIETILHGTEYSHRPEQAQPIGYIPKHSSPHVTA